MLAAVILSYWWQVLYLLPSLDYSIYSWGTMDGRLLLIHLQMKTDSERSGDLPQSLRVGWGFQPVWPLIFPLAKCIWLPYFSSLLFLVTGHFGRRRKGFILFSNRIIAHRGSHEGLDKIPFNECRLEQVCLDTPGFDTPKGLRGLQNSPECEFGPI